MALCVISLSMSRFLLPHVQQPEETPEEKKKSNLPTFFYYQRMGNLNLLICAACGISFSAGFFYNLVVFLRPMGEPTPLILTLLFGIGGLLAIVFLKLPLEKDIYQASCLLSRSCFAGMPLGRSCTVSLRACPSLGYASVSASSPCTFSWPYRPCRRASRKTKRKNFMLA